MIGQWLVERRPDALFLARVMLAPAWQGRGIASALIRELQAEARAGGLPLTLQVWEENPARALYERLGFAVTGAREFRVQMRWEADQSESRAGLSSPGGGSSGGDVSAGCAAGAGGDGGAPSG